VPTLIRRRGFDEHRTSVPLHGGDVVWAQDAFPDALLPWIDLSTGISPWSYSVEAVDVFWNRLPSPAALQTLLAAARTCYRIPPKCAVTATAGAELAIRLLPKVLDVRGRIGIVGPTYSSHADAWRQAGYEVDVVGAVADIGTECTLAVIVSPNNPDGRCVDSSTLASLADRQAEKDGYLVVDRSFADVSTEPAALPYHSSLIELRSFGKFFGLPGIRLGFVIAEEKITTAFRRILGAWPLNAAALAFGCEALPDENWQQQMRTKLIAASAELDAVLLRHGVPVIGGTSLFRLARVGDARGLFRDLASHGILTRIFDYDPHWIRFGLPADENAWKRLTQALRYFSGRTANG
jgi:cobalamin biosynthetic protein CobC